jgi:hypothetical protein
MVDSARMSLSKPPAKNAELALADGKISKAEAFILERTVQTRTAKEVTRAMARLVKKANRLQHQGKARQGELQTDLYELRQLKANCHEDSSGLCNRINRSVDRRIARKESALEQALAPQRRSEKCVEAYDALRDIAYRHGKDSTERIALRPDDVLLSKPVIRHRGHNVFNTPVYGLEFVPKRSLPVARSPNVSSDTKITHESNESAKLTVENRNE